MDMEETKFLSELTQKEKLVILRHELTLHERVQNSIDNIAEVLGILEQIEQKGKSVLAVFGNENANAEEVALHMAVLVSMTDLVECIVPASIYGQYSNFFTAFNIFCKQCGNTDFLQDNVEELVSSLELFLECMDGLKKDMRD